MQRLIATLTFFLASCALASPKALNFEPPSRYGNPVSYTVEGKRYHVLPNAQRFSQRGVASWYGPKFDGKKTAMGHDYDMHAMTAAHKTLPLPTLVSVKNLENGRIITVKINDRGPFHDNRVIDLSYSAAKALGMIDKGTANVEITALTPKNTITPKHQRYLQIGAFTKSINALRFMASLKHKLNYPIRVQERAHARGKHFAVQLGPVPNHFHDQRLRKALSFHGIDRFLTVLEPS